MKSTALNSQANRYYVLVLCKGKCNKRMIKILIKICNSVYLFDYGFG